MMNEIQVKIWMVCTLIGMIAIQILNFFRAQSMSKEQANDIKAVQRKLESGLGLKCKGCQKDNEIGAMFCRRCGQSFRLKEEVTKKFPRAIRRLQDQFEKLEVGPAFRPVANNFTCLKDKFGIHFEDQCTGRCLNCGAQLASEIHWLEPKTQKCCMCGKFKDDILRREYACVIR